MDFRRPRNSAIALAIVIGFAIPSERSAEAGLIINLTEVANAAPTNATGTGELSEIMRAAADVWQLAFSDDAISHTLQITYGWFQLAESGVLGSHTLAAQSGTPNRETAGYLFFDNDGSSKFFLDGTLDATDPLNAGNSEFSQYTDSDADMGGGTLNTGRVFTGASGAAAGAFDLFTVALHEIGHALGLSSLNTSYQAEAWPDNDIDVTGSLPFAGSVIQTNNTGTNPGSGSSFVSNAHLTASTALMYAYISKGERKLPTGIDILANAQLSQFANPNLDLVSSLPVSAGSGLPLTTTGTSVPEPSSWALMVGLGLGVLTIRRKQSPSTAA